MRADARRNHDRLLAEARAAFVEFGADAPLEEVAGRAGVGIGTLYRHFPTREALLEALLRDRFDTLTAAAGELGEREPPRAALELWTRGFLETSTAYRGVTAALMATLRDETSALHASCEAMRRAGEGLLTRAQGAGDIRSDVDPNELLALVSGVAWAHEQGTAGRPDGLDRMLSLVFEGLVPR